MAQLGAIAAGLAVTLFGISVAAAQPQSRAHPSSSHGGADIDATGAVVSKRAAAEMRRETAASLMEEWAEDVAYGHLQAWSSENRIALADLDRQYAGRIAFFGRLVERAVLRDEKRRFARRWPIRRYEHRPETMRIHCNAEAGRCDVHSIIDWEAAHPGRHARSRGSARFELGISFAGAQPLVVREAGNVVTTRAASN